MKMYINQTVWALLWHELCLHSTSWWAGEVSPSSDQTRAHQWQRGLSSHRPRCVYVRVSVCHSGIKFMRAMRMAQAEKLVEVQCENGGTEERRRQGVVPELPAGSQCPELAQHVDTEPVPDLKPPFFSQRERGEGIQGWEQPVRARAWFILSFFSDHADWLLLSLCKTLWLCDLALIILDDMLVALQSGGQMHGQSQPLDESGMQCFVVHLSTWIQLSLDRK